MLVLRVVYFESLKVGLLSMVSFSSIFQNQTHFPEHARFWKIKEKIPGLSRIYQTKPNICSNWTGRVCQKL